MTEILLAEDLRGPDGGPVAIELACLDGAPWVELTAAEAHAVELSRIGDAARRVLGKLGRLLAPDAATGIVGRRVRTENAARAAAYARAATRRVTAAVAAGTSRRDAVEAERQNLRRAQDAAEQRIRAGAVLDGLVAANGPRIRWRAVLDDRTTPTCRGLHGQVIDVRRPGPLPGITHPGCRCTAEAVTTTRALSRPSTPDRPHQNQEIHMAVIETNTAATPVELAAKIKANRREIAALRREIGTRADAYDSRTLSEMPDPDAIDPIGHLLDRSGNPRIDPGVDAAGPLVSEVAPGQGRWTDAEMKALAATWPGGREEWLTRSPADRDAAAANLRAGVGYNAMPAVGLTASATPDLDQHRMTGRSRLARAARARAATEMAEYARRSGLA